VPAVLIASLLAIPLGMLAAWKQNTSRRCAIVTAAIVLPLDPELLAGPHLPAGVRLKLDLLPVVGYVSPLENLGGLRYLVMPVTALALIETGVLIRMARSSTIEVLRLEYITHARAKGLAEFAVALRHALKNAMAPTWTMIGLAAGSLLGGRRRDRDRVHAAGHRAAAGRQHLRARLPVVQGCLLFVTLIYVLVNLPWTLAIPSSIRGCGCELRASPRPNAIAGRPARADARRGHRGPRAHALRPVATTSWRA
jgi:peptide/nickel transport system permease protein